MDAVLAGRYELGPVLGVGGMARVVAARDMRLDRRVAVKLVAAAAVDPSGRERFVREARSSARFSHPNAVAVYDAGEDGGSLYLVMELVDGPSLAARLAAGPLPVADAVAVAGNVLAALGAAHAAGIVHRDVKPGNILLSADGTAKLADFGIAKRLDDLSADLTATGQFVGTPKYLAPEQVTGEPATPATDLYAVGVVLYEMVTGEPPFDAGTPMATAIAQRDAPAPDVRTVADVPSAVAATIERALAKDPAERFASAADMRAALHGGSVAAAIPASPLARTATMPASDRPASRRRRRAVALAAAVVALVAVVAVLALAGADDGANGGAADPAATSAASVATATPATAVPPQTAAPSAPSPAPSPATTSPPTTVPATPPETAAPAAPSPTTLAELRELVAADPARFGDAGESLVRELQRVEDDNGGRAAERAGALLERIDRWIDDGELVPDVAALAAPVLGPLADAASEDGNNGGGNGDD